MYPRLPVVFVILNADCNMPITAPSVGTRPKKRGADNRSASQHDYTPETQHGLLISEIVHDLHAPGPRSDRRGVGPQTGHVEAVRQRVLAGQVAAKQAERCATALSIVDRTHPGSSACRSAELRSVGLLHEQVIDETDRRRESMPGLDAISHS